MGQAFLHRRQHVFAGFGEHHAGRVQTGAGEAGGEQIRALLHPQHRPLHPRQHAGEEQGRGGAVFGIRTGARDFMQRAHKQATGTVEVFNAERDCPGCAWGVTMPDPRDLGAQAGDDLGTGGQ